MAYGAWQVVYPLERNPSSVGLNIGANGEAWYIVVVSTTGVVDPVGAMRSNIAKMASGRSDQLIELR